MSDDFFGDMGTTKTPGPGYEYLGVGKYEIEILELKHKDAKFIAEVAILKAAPNGGKGPDNAVGDKVSWMVNCGGTAKQTEMGKVDVKGFLAAAVKSAGRDPGTITEAMWKSLGGKMCGRNNEARGLRIGAQLWRGHNKTTGEEYKIPTARFTPIDGQRRPSLFEVFGASTPAAAGTGGAKPPSGNLLEKLKEGLVNAKAKGVTADQVMDANGSGYKKAIGAGITPEQYLAAVEDVFGDAPADDFSFA